MNSPVRIFVASLFAICLFTLSALGDGPLTRVPNTTLQMPPNPPTFGFTAENAFGTMTFSNAVGITHPPGETNRLFVIGKNGLIFVITNLAAPTRTLFMDISGRIISTISNSGGTGEQGLLGMAFHPGYATNRFFFVFYTGTNQVTGTSRHDILSRFEISLANTNAGDPNSEVLLFAQLDEQPNHNGGDIKFGPDGYLYVPLGDEGAGNDSQNNSQTITKDFFSAMLRLDVDKLSGIPPNPHTARFGTTNYFIPADNPFIGATSFNGVAVNSNQVRTEFWAVGLRNPWRMNFDPLTGALYCGDVGQDAGSGWEEVNIITNGGNYGWAYMHNTNSGPKIAQAPVGFAQTQTPPLFAYQTSAGVGRAIIGGVLYRGSRLSQLTGAYVYGDGVTGTLWALRHSGNTIITNQVLGITDIGLSGFGIDPRNGDILYCVLQSAPGSTVKRINYSTLTNGPALPATLAETGAFADTAELEPSAGVVAYDLNVPFWSDNAIKSRWFSVPNTNLLVGFHPTENWFFPTGTVWVKHFDLELTNGVPSSKKRIETRLLVRNAGGVYGVTYRWGDSLTNAILVPEEGMDEDFLIDDGGGIIRTQVWHYPSWSECVTCHTPAGGLGLGFNTPQLNRDHDYSGVVTNQLLALSAAGYLNTNLAAADDLIALAHASDTNASLEFRSRSYFTANCVQCHQPAGTVAAANWDARITTPIGQADLINAVPFNNLGSTNNRVIKPLAPTNSTLFRRIAEFGPFHMPPLATSVLNIEATNLLHDWIMTLSNTFWVNPTPASRSVIVGQSTTYDVELNPTDDFTDPVTLNISGLPANTVATFDPAVISGPTNATLTIVSSNNTPPGVYVLEIHGESASHTNTGLVTLNVTLIPPTLAGTLFWTGAQGDGNWSSSFNWTNIPAGGYGPPSPSNSVSFFNTGTTGNSATVNNTMDVNLAIDSTRIRSLAYSNSVGFHRTLIAPGTTLAISNNTTGNALLVGTGIDSGSNQTVTASITGTGGLLSINNSSANVSIRQGGAAGTHQATLDLSDLDAFDATVARLLVAGDGAAAVGDNRLSGVLYLARTNTLNLVGGSASSPALNIGDHPSNGRGNPPVLLLPSFLYLGQQNTISANTITVGRQKAAPVSMLFNPALVGNGPTAVFRGVGGGNNRVTTWSIGDNSAQGTSNQASEGTNDFTGGVVDALVATLYVGRGETGTGNLAGTGTGTLSFDQGVMDIDTLEVGFQSQANSASAGIGRVNVNGTATLIVNGSLRLAHYQGGTGISQGTLSVTGGMVRANSVLAGGGTSTLNLNGGTLALTNSAGTAGASLTSATLNNGTLVVRFNGAAIATNLVATTLNASGVNSIVVEAAANLTGIVQFPVAHYGSLNGSFANFALTSVPPGYIAVLVDNAAQNRIDVRIAPIAAVIPTITGVTRVEPNLILAGTNGLPEASYYVLTSTNVGLPLSSWTAIATNLFDGMGQFQFTNGIDPEVPEQFFLLQLPQQP